MTSSADREHSLAELQDWLARVVTAPDGLAAGLRDACAQHGDGMPIRIPPDGKPGERLAIYARGYLDRLLSALRTDYPALRALVGDELFDQFALDYLRVCPPRHSSLFQLGAGLADHLERTRPADDAVDADQRALLRLPIDLARLERARLDAVRSPGCEGAPITLGTTVDALLGPGAPIVVTPCLRIVELAHDVRPFLAAVDRGEPPGAPEPRPICLAVSRRDYRLTLTELLPWQQHTLLACHAPTALAALADQVVEFASRGEALAELLLWLPVAESLGLIMPA